MLRPGGLDPVRCRRAGILSLTEPPATPPQSLRGRLTFGLIPLASAVVSYAAAGTGVDPNRYLTTSRSLVPDSFDWLVNSQNVNGPGTSVRLPVLPMLLSGVREIDASLIRFDVVGAMALFLSLLALGTIVFHFRQSYRIAFATQVFFGVNATFVGFHQYVLADTVAVAFMLCGIAAALWKREHLGSVLIGIGGVTQYAILLVLAPLVMFIVLTSSSLPAAVKRAVRCGLLGLTPLALNLVWKEISLGDPMYTKIDQLGLLSFSALSLPYYAVNTIGFLGIPGACLVVRTLRDKHREPIALTKPVVASYTLVGGSAVLLAGFFIVLYGWLDKRFLLYSLPLIVVVVISLARLDRRRDWYLIVGAIVFGSFSGSSAFAGDEVALLPGLQLQIAGIADQTDTTQPIMLHPRLRTTGRVGLGGSGLFATPRRLVDAAGIQAKIDDPSACFAPFEVYIARSLDQLSRGRPRNVYAICG